MVIGQGNDTDSKRLVQEWDANMNVALEDGWTNEFWVGGQSLEVQDGKTRVKKNEERIRDFGRSRGNEKVSSVKAMALRRGIFDLSGGPLLRFSRFVWSLLSHSC